MVRGPFRNAFCHYDITRFAPEIDSYFIFDVLLKESENRKHPLFRFRSEFWVHFVQFFQHKTKTYWTLQVIWYCWKYEFCPVAMQDMLVWDLSMAFWFWTWMEREKRRKLMATSDDITVFQYFDMLLWLDVTEAHTSTVGVHLCCTVHFLSIYACSWFDWLIDFLKLICFLPGEALLYPLRFWWRMTYSSFNTYPHHQKPSSNCLL